MGYYHSSIPILRMPSLVNTSWVTDALLCTYCTGISPLSLLISLPISHYFLSLSFYLLAKKPPIIYIHFCILLDRDLSRYNSISLGLFLWAVALLMKGRELLGAVAFSLALNYKQMELYHAPPFFFYMLSNSFNGKQHWYSYSFFVYSFIHSFICVFIILFYYWFLFFFQVFLLFFFL